MPIRTNSKRAFTLVEIMVAASLLMLVGTGAMRIFSSAGKAQQQYSQQVILQMESRKAFDSLLYQLREGVSIVRPVLGETQDFLVFKDLLNQITLVYLEPNHQMAKELNRKVYKLVAYQAAYPGFAAEARQTVIMDSVRRIRFSCLSPSSIQVNATIISSRGEYQFIANVGLLNGGGLE
jgi:type II secretory pathway pseudopilin PulG